MVKLMTLFNVNIRIINCKYQIIENTYELE